MILNVVSSVNEFYTRCCHHNKDKKYYVPELRSPGCEDCVISHASAIRIYLYSYQKCIVYVPKLHQHIQYYVHNGNYVVRLLPNEVAQPYPEKSESLCHCCHRQVSSKFKFCSVLCRLTRRRKRHLPKRSAWM
jgi:hypothetical protein